MKSKRLVAAFISAILLSFNSAICVSNAVVIEPEIVKSEVWTTSYYIDDDESTLYPYIDCQADIYSDGTVKCYFWNTHEWDGFATVSHVVTILSSQPYSTDSNVYSFYKGKTVDFEWGGTIIPLAEKKNGNPKTMTADFSFWKDRDISYYPPEYKVNKVKSYFSNIQNKEYYSTNTYYDYSDCGVGHFSDYSYKGALPKLPVNQKSEVTFTPLVDPVDTYIIRFLGNDITVSPDILSSHIVATPQLTEQEKQIAELEKENSKFKAELERLKQDPNSLRDDIMRLDANEDGFVDAIDASIVLAIYANNSTNKNPITKLSDYFNMINNK